MLSAELWGCHLLDPLPACPFPTGTTHGPSRQASAGADTPQPTSQCTQDPLGSLACAPLPCPLGNSVLYREGVQRWWHEPLLKTVRLGPRGSGRALCFSCPRPSRLASLVKRTDQATGGQDMEQGEDCPLPWDSPRWRDLESGRNLLTHITAWGPSPPQTPCCNGPTLLFLNYWSGVALACSQGLCSLRAGAAALG